MTPTETVDAMLAVWNVRDLSLVRAHLEAVLAHGVEFIDPTIVTRGVDEFEANVCDFRRKYPNAVISRTSGVDSHHDLHRYTWAIHVGSKLVLSGSDVTQTDQSEKVVRVLGFFGPLPALG